MANPGTARPGRMMASGATTAIWAVSRSRKRLLRRLHAGPAWYWRRQGGISGHAVLQPNSTRKRRAKMNKPRRGKQQKKREAPASPKARVVLTDQELEQV